MDTDGLSIICAGIGYAQEDDNGALIGYAKCEYCLDNLKDLQRFLRRDDPQRRPVFKQICKWKTVSQNLVPLIEHYHIDRNLVINAVKILVFLTMPIDHSSDDIAQQMEYLWDLKNALTRHVTIAVVVSLLEDPLDHLERNSFTEDDWKLVQLVLTLFRNVLAIHDITLQQKSAGSAAQFLSLTDRFLDLMFQENVMDLILVLTQHVDDSSGYLRQDNILLLETFYYIFLGQEPELIAKFSKRSSKVKEDMATTVDSLRSIMEEEKEKRRRISLRNVERHSQFSGTFTRVGVAGSKTVFKRNPASASGNGLIKVHNKVQKGSVQRIAWDHSNLPSAKGDTLEKLHEFLIQFLSGYYNVLMQSVYDDITKECPSIDKAEIMIYFRVATFALAFQHQKILVSKELDSEEPISDPSHQNADNMPFHGDICGPVAATISEAMFNFVVSKWLEAFDSVKTTNDYKSLAAAGSLFKNMIRMLDLVLKILPDGCKETQTARVLLYKLFYNQTDQGLTYFLLNMFKSFNTQKQPKRELADLLEVIHIMLRLMEKLQARGTLRVARKSRKSRKKKTLKGAGHSEADNSREHSNLNNSVDEAGKAEGHISEAHADSNDHENKQSAEPCLADPGVDQEDTSISSKVADSAATLDNGGPNGDDMPNFGGERANTGSTEPVHEEIDSSSDDQLPEINEVDFNISSLVATFANSCVIHNLCWLLKYYKSNSVSTNHYIICMFRRICEDLDISPMLYQLSILRIFHDILADQKSSQSKEYASIVIFLTKFIRKMLKLMKERPMLFVEVLFYKTRRECQCITADALSSDIAGFRKDLRSLYNDGISTDGTNFRQKSIADSLGDDEFTIPGLDNATQVTVDDHLSEVLHEDDLYKNKESMSEKDNMRSISNDNSEMNGRSWSMIPSKRKKGYVFDQEQETAIKNLYHKYKNNHKCSRLIAEALDPEGNITAVQVYRKLKQLGLYTGKRKKSAGGDATFPTGNDPIVEAGTSFTGTEISRSHKEQGTNSHLEASFKHHKNCSHMIAKVLDDNTCTASQVSYKHEQLGLVASKEKNSSESSKPSRNEENGEKGVLLEETLLAIKKRKKRSSREDKSISQQTVEDDSGEETLGDMLRRRRSKSSSTEAAHENVTEHKVIAMEYDSDKEVLATLLKDRGERQAHQSLKLDDKDGENDGIEDEQKDRKDELENGDLTPMDDDDDDDDDDVDMTAGLDNPNSGELYTEVEMDYVDSGDEAIYRPMPQEMGRRRILKVVIDGEDDE